MNNPAARAPRGPSMDIVLTSSEVVPFSKTGGMADVVGALAVHLADRGHRVMTVSPAYQGTDWYGQGFEWTNQEARVDLRGETLSPRFLVRRDRGLTHVLVQHPFYERNGIYGDEHGTFGDNHVRYALLSRAAIEAARHIPQADGALMGDHPVFHVHDWQTSLVPVYLNALYRPLGLLPHAATVLTLHNLAHQGIFPGDQYTDLELAPRWGSDWGLGWRDGMGFLKAGILQTDRLATVSPTYAKEILRDGGAFGLEGVLRARARDLSGILNGIDADLWNPATDPHLAATYSLDDLEGKRTCKASLQHELGLPVDPTTPLLACVTRLDPQKGVDWIVDAIPWMVREGAQVVVMGTAKVAHKHYEDMLRSMQHRFPRSVRAWIGFSETIAHRIEAGADMFLMPSVFEPCGLSQLYSLRYGTVPIVRSTGGLVDTVEPYNPHSDSGTGWRFDEPTTAAFIHAVWNALRTYRDAPAAFEGIMRRGMAQDLSWAKAAPKYEAVYRAALARRVPSMAGV